MITVDNLKNVVLCASTLQGVDDKLHEIQAMLYSIRLILPESLHEKLSSYAKLSRALIDEYRDTFTEEDMQILAAIAEDKTDILAEGKFGRIIVKKEEEPGVDLNISRILGKSE